MLLYVRTPEEVSVIQDVLAGIGAEMVVCADIPDLCRQMAQDADAVLLTEQSLTEGALSVLAEALRNQPQWSDLPILFVATGGLESPLAVEAMQELPNMLVLDRPVRIATLAGALRMAARIRTKQRQVRDLLDERRRAQEALEEANERLHAQANDLGALNEQLLTEREELQRQSRELRQLKDQAERTTRAVENLARLVEENPDPAFRVSLDGRIQYGNPASFKLAHQWNGAERRKVPPVVQEIVSAACARTEVIRREMAFGARTYLITVAPALPAAAYVNIFARDITVRKQAEEALRESEQRLALALSGTRVGLCYRDVATGEMRCTEQFARIWGLRTTTTTTTTTTTLSQIYHYHDWAEHVHPEDLPRVEAEQRRCMAERVPCETEYRIMRPDASVCWVAERSVYRYDPDGQPTHLLGIFMDITDRKRAEEALHALTATLEAKVAERTGELRRRAKQLQKLTLDMSEAEDRERERLAQILHDDLQQELAAAKFHLSIVRSRVKYDPPMQEITTKVDEMLKDAIGKSRSLSHELSPAVLRQGNFVEILQWLANEMQVKHGLTVRVRGQAHAQSDAIKAFLYRAAQELLFNAVKHAQVSEAKVRVRECGDYVCLSVSDRGRGFDPGKLRETAGFGLLSIRERIELLGGRMKIRSAPGQGSTFFVVVPNRETAGELAKEAARAPEDETRLRVLLADDHQVVRQGLVSLLSEEEMIEVVGEATNGREAVDLTDELHPDVVVMDVLMPVMNGEEATRQIKKDLPQTRIVAFSMREEPDVRERMCQAGAESYLLKTAPYKELLAAIRGASPSDSTIPCVSAV